MCYQKCYNKEIKRGIYLSRIFAKQINPRFFPNFQNFFWYLKIKDVIFGSRNPTHKSTIY